MAITSYSDNWKFHVFDWSSWEYIDTVHSLGVTVWNSFMDQVVEKIHISLWRWEVFYGKWKDEKYFKVSEAHQYNAQFGDPEL